MSAAREEQRVGSRSCHELPEEQDLGSALNLDVHVIAIW